MGHIFISYSHKDKAYVHKLHKALQDEGFDAWIDGRIDYGDQWLKVIQKHLDECDVFILVMSTNSSESDMVQNEVTRAREKKKPIFPLLLEGDNWLVVQAKQYFDVRDSSLPTEKFYKRLEKETSRRDLKVQPKPPQTIQAQPQQPKLTAGGIHSLNVKNLGIGFIVFSALLLVAFGWNYLLRNVPASLTEAPVTLTITEENTADLSKTFAPSPTSTLTPVPLTFTPTPGIGSTMTSEKDGMTMVYVPAGEFIMGSDNGNSDEAPEHIVFLDAYWIDETEVTHTMYSECLIAQKCTSWWGTVDSKTPVNYVSWTDAISYCEWVGRRLPTEAEWEKAARGAIGSKYPWGNEVPNSSLLAFNLKDIPVVGSYPLGKSVYGAYDMAGSLWEWVSSLPFQYPYDFSDGRENMYEPRARVVRGGSYLNDAESVLSTNRVVYVATERMGSVGFRCAMNADE